MRTNEKNEQKLYVKACLGKWDYSDYQSALNAADQYNESITLVEHPMVPYLCPYQEKHKKNSRPVWHKGHNRVFPQKQSCIYLEESRKRARGILPLDYNISIIPMVQAIVVSHWWAHPVDRKLDQSDVSITKSGQDYYSHPHYQ